MSVDVRQFSGIDQYIAPDSLQLAVKAARTLQKPLLIKGESGTGKTLLAEQIAKSLWLKLITWHIKSTTKAQQGLYEYDAVSRLGDSQLGHAQIHEIKNYIKPGKLWEAFTSPQRCVMRPVKLYQAIHRLILIITSNNEKQLPDAFLRRCFFHYIEFPDEAMMRQIVELHFPHISATLLQQALQIFFQLRQIPGLKKLPSTSELIDWLPLIMADELPEQVLHQHDQSKIIPPLYGALIKNEQDLQLLERLAFLARR